MKKIDKKTTLIVAGVVITILIIIIGIVVFSHRKSNKIKEYEKYLTTISIVTIKEQRESHFLARLYCDEINCKLSSNDKGEFFYQNNELIHVEDSQNLSVYNTKYFYKNIYNIVSHQEKLKNVKEEINKIKIDSKDMNEILKNLYLDISVKSNVELTVNIKDNIITNIKFTLDKVGLYDNILVEMSYQKLSNNFKVDTSLIQSENENETYVDHDSRFDEYTKVKRKKIDKNLLMVD